MCLAKLLFHEKTWIPTFLTRISKHYQYNDWEFFQKMTVIIFNGTIANWKWNNATSSNPLEEETCQTTGVLLKLLYFERPPPWHVKIVTLTSPLLCISASVKWRLTLEFMSASSSSLLPSLTPPPLHLLYSNHVSPVFPAGCHVQLFSTSQKWL